MTSKQIFFSGYLFYKISHVQFPLFICRRHWCMRQAWLAEWKSGSQLGPSTFQTGSTRHVGHLLAYCTCPGWLWGWRILWNEDWQGKPKYAEKTCPSATLSTTNPTWPDLGSNPGRRGGKPATNRLSYGAALTQHLAENIGRKFDYRTKFRGICLRILFSPGLKFRQCYQHKYRTILHQCKSIAWDSEVYNSSYFSGKIYDKFDVRDRICYRLWILRRLGCF
jgi:hypothetical protein